MKTCCTVFGILTAVSAVVFQIAVQPDLVKWKANVKTGLKALQDLRELPPEEVEGFFKAYDVLEKLGTDDRHGVKTEEEVNGIRDYYRVLHRILALGVVMEVMMLPPALDSSAGVMKNLELFFDRMLGFLNLKPGDTVMDVGSGRGKISQWAQRTKGVKTIQVNFDETQLEYSKYVAREAGNSDFFEWRHQDYNLPFPYVEDGTLDAEFCAQACTFLANKTKFLAEVYRMLKPGGYMYHLEWLTKDKSENKSTVTNYDRTNQTHRELVRRAGVLMGGALPSGIYEWEQAFHANGFELIASREPGVTHSISLLQRVDDTYRPLTELLCKLADYGIVPMRLKELFVRLRKYVDATFEAHELDLASATHEFVARKPL